MAVGIAGKAKMPRHSFVDEGYPGAKMDAATARHPQATAHGGPCGGGSGSAPVLIGPLLETTAVAGPLCPGYPHHNIMILLLKIHIEPGLTAINANRLGIGVCYQDEP